MSERVHPREVSSALRRANLSGTFVVGRYALAPYMACGHGCAYCDGRAERYWVDGDFDRDIVARRNLPDLLADELPRLREPGFVTLGSGITDAYQPVEGSERITRACLEVLAAHDFPVTLMTKSALALRDLDLVRRINERSRFLFIVSLAHADDATRAVYEPGASSVDERLNALRTFAEAGCATGVLAMPLLPGITDEPQTVSLLYDRLADAGVDFIQPGGLTLRPGRQKTFFLDRLRGDRPELLEAYSRLYGEERASGAPRKTYSGEITERCLAENSRVGIPYLVPHRIYAPHLAPYDAANVLLSHMCELYAGRGVETGRLRAASGRYREWLTARKREYNRHRSWDYRELTEEVVAPGALEGIVANDRLAAFLRRVMVEGVRFDYLRLELDG